MEAEAAPGQALGEAEEMATPGKGEAEERLQEAGGGEEAPPGKRASEASGAAAEDEQQQLPQVEEGEGEAAAAAAAASERPSSAGEGKEDGEASVSSAGASPVSPQPPPEAEDEEEEEEAEAVPSSEELFGARLSVRGAHFAEPEPRPPSRPPTDEGVGRTISRSLWELEQELGSAAWLDPGDSPPGDEEEEKEEAEADAAQRQLEARLAEEQRQRAELVEQYRQLLAEGAPLHRYNTRLQCKLAELLNKGKEGARAELEQHISDKEQRYSRYLAMLEELRSQQQEEMAWYQREMDILQRTCEDKLARVNGQWKAYQAAKKEVAVFTMGRRLGGKQAAIRKVDHLLSREQRKEIEMTEARMENIKLKHRFQQLDSSLKAQEELAEGLHLIDFEQLKIENQTYNEKIEERNEELLKLRRKITNTVQILTQVKEKLQFVEADNQDQKAQLLEAEALVSQKRELLTKTKQVRDRLRTDNQRLQQKCGLLGNTTLLRDFEVKVDAAEVLNQKLELLKRHHAGLSLTCNGIKKKIKAVKSFLPV